MPTDKPGGAVKGNSQYNFEGIAGYSRCSKETMEDLYEGGELIVGKGFISRENYESRAMKKENKQQLDRIMLVQLPRV